MDNKKYLTANDVRVEINGKEIEKLKKRISELELMLESAEREKQFNHDLYIENMHQSVKYRSAFKALLEEFKK